MAQTFEQWAAGDSGWITYDDRSVPMQVIIASENGISLLVSFEALLGGYAGTMPLVWMSQECEFRCLIKQHCAVLTKEAPHGVPAL